ncbi:unnamed protein product [Acanthoscelides obtectus]|uniref:Transmembrane protein n=1 Tax=Acanthoscelides obtectus TaxID=200917 RepID=A0A9P0KS00_ACAOB|nr:unnamed protein product [Acanthoscelides obtectus]CAK1678302.1 hypothetical protein AOBTE_LOCUS31810 [Acanthoscelides obtectus]
MIKLTLLLSSLELILADYCEFGTCGDNQYCCGENKCCNKTVDIWYYWAGILLIVIIILLLLYFFKKSKCNELQQDEERLLI